MKPLHENQISGAPSARPKDEGNATRLSERDLKLLSLAFIGDTDGIFYFRDPADPARTYSGDRADYVEWRQVRARHFLIDTETANAALWMNVKKAVR
jgi:hypothetical protein